MASKQTTCAGSCQVHHDRVHRGCIQTWHSAFQILETQAVDGVARLSVSEKISERAHQLLLPSLPDSHFLLSLKATTRAAHLASSIIS
jgi:hypothetical protein